MPHSGIAKLSATGIVTTIAALKEITNFKKNHNYVWTSFYLAK
jgi:hypothetical protein